MSNNVSNSPGSKNSFALINAVPIININCINPTIPIPIVFPNTIVFGSVDVTNVLHRIILAIT